MKPSAPQQTPSPPHDSIVTIGLEYHVALLVREELNYLLDPGDTGKQQALLASIERLNRASDLLGESLSWLVAHEIQAHLEKWWKHPPVVGQDPATIEWGWLKIYSDHSSRFFEEQPSDASIATRKNCWPASAVNPDNPTTR